LLSLADGKSTYKVYTIDLLGRDTPERYEWQHAGLSPQDLEDRLVEARLEGIGFVTAFPHITKVFRFHPDGETVLTVRAFRTPSMDAYDLDRSDGFVEFACLAEALIAAEEYRFWAAAERVETYLESWSDVEAAVVADHGKLRRYWDA
jgi:hypothetical protein